MPEYRHQVVIKYAVNGLIDTHRVLGSAWVCVEFLSDSDDELDELVTDELFVRVVVGVASRIVVHRAEHHVHGVAEDGLLVDQFSSGSQREE